MTLTTNQPVTNLFITIQGQGSTGQLGPIKINADGSFSQVVHSTSFFSSAGNYTITAQYGSYTSSSLIFYYPAPTPSATTVPSTATTPAPQSQPSQQTTIPATPTTTPTPQTPTQQSQSSQQTTPAPQSQPVQQAITTLIPHPQPSQQITSPSTSSSTIQNTIPSTKSVPTRTIPIAPTTIPLPQAVPQQNTPTTPPVSSTPTTISSQPALQEPIGVKTVYNWWKQGKISTEDFMKGTQYLINSGIIHSK